MEQKPTNGSQPVLKAKDVARIMGCSIPTVYYRANRGLLPGAKRIGRALVFHRDTFMSWWVTENGE